MSNGRMVPKHGNNTHYYIISEDSILSKETQFFGRASHIIGRMCTAATTVNASSIPSPEVLMEVFKLEFTGRIKLNETCPGMDPAVQSSMKYRHQQHSKYR